MAMFDRYIDKYNPSQSDVVPEEDLPNQGQEITPTCKSCGASYFLAPITKQYQEENFGITRPPLCVECRCAALQMAFDRNASELASTAYQRIAGAPTRR